MEQVDQQWQTLSFLPTFFLCWTFGSAVQLAALSDYLKKRCISTHGTRVSAQVDYLIQSQLLFILRKSTAALSIIRNYFRHFY